MRERGGLVGVGGLGGRKETRTWFAVDKKGFPLLHKLFQTKLKCKSVTRYDEWFVTRLLVDDGRVQGVVALELMTGRIQAITGRAVILCTGGCGGGFPVSNHAPLQNGGGPGPGHPPRPPPKGHGIGP